MIDCGSNKMNLYAIQFNRLSGSKDISRYCDTVLSSGLFREHILYFSYREELLEFIRKRIVLVSEYKKNIVNNIKLDFNSDLYLVREFKIYYLDLLIERIDKSFIEYNKDKDKDIGLYLIRGNRKRFGKSVDYDLYYKDFKLARHILLSNIRGKISLEKLYMMQEIKYFDIIE